MATKDWLVPVVVGAIGFAAMLALPEPEADAQEEHGPHFEFPFRDIAMTGPTPAGFQVLATLHPPLASPADCPEAVGSGTRAAFDQDPQSFGSGARGPLTVDDLHVEAVCVGPGLAVLDLGDWTSLTLSDEGLQGDVLDLGQATAGPRLGLAGYNGTRVTVHVFNGEGELVFSNGNASEQARLMRNSSPDQLPQGVWYLGDAPTAPAGTQPLPLAARVVLPQLRGALEGLPVGGVATIRTDAQAGFFGTLYITAQVDELVYAP